MPEIDDGQGNAATTNSRNKIKTTITPSYTNGGMTDAQRSGGSNVASLYGSGVTAQSATGANYPAAYFRENQGPTTKSGMLLAALSPTKAMLKEATKTFWNQTKYGMNDAVKTHYDKMVANGLPTGKSVQDVVNDAREAYYVDNPKARGDIRNGDTGGVEIKLENGKSIWISTDDNKVVSGSSNAGSHTVDPDTGDVIVDEVEAEEAKLGEIGLTNVTGPDGRPTWAPTDPNAEGAAAPVVDPYAPTWNQAPTGMFSGGSRNFDESNNGLGTKLRSTGIPKQRQPQYSQAPQSQASAYELAARQNMLLPQAPQASTRPQANPDSIAAYQSQGTPEAYQSQGTPEAYQAPQLATGATIPQGAADAGTFRPVTFRSGTGTSTTDAGGTTTALSGPYAGLSSLVGSGQGLLTQAGANAQRAPDQLNFDMNTDQRAQDLFAQRSALLEPAFAQQRALAQQDMFGSGRLGLRLAGQGVGAGSGMVQPDAFGMNQAQSQALAGLSSQSTDDAFAQAQAMAGLESQRFSQNQQAQQQQYANLTSSGEGMLSAGIQGAQLEAAIAQQQMQNQQNQQAQGLSQQRLNLDAQGQAQNFGLASQGQAQNFGLARDQFGLASQGQAQEYGLSRDRFGLAQQTQNQNYSLANRAQNLSELANSQNFGLASQGQQQNYGLAQQQQMQDYGLGQQKMGLATQQQLQDYEMGMLTGNRNYNLSRDVAAQNYELATENNRINLITGQAKANNLNYQPNDWLNVALGVGSAYAGTVGGAAQITDWLDWT